MELRFIEQPVISINKETCSKCGSCSKICPVRIFSSSEGSITIMPRLEECCLCGQCISGCSTGSIIHSGFEKSNFEKILNKKPVSPELAFEFLSQRRSVRNYRKETPQKELLEKIVEIAGYAPGSPHHRIGWVRNVTIVYGEENMKTVLDLTADYIRKILKLLNSGFLKVMSRFSASAKAGLGVVPDLEMRINDYRHKCDSIIYNAPVAMFFHAPENSSTPQTDCDTAQLFVQLYAEANGLATCWNGLIQGAAAGDHLQGFRKLAEFLQIPKGRKCYAAMTLGYPSIGLHSIPERKVDVSWINGNS